MARTQRDWMMLRRVRTTDSPQSRTPSLMKIFWRTRVMSPTMLEIMVMMIMILRIKSRYLEMMVMTPAT